MSVPETNTHTLGCFGDVDDCFVFLVMENGLGPPPSIMSDLLDFRYKGVCFTLA